MREIFAKIKVSTFAISCNDKIIGTCFLTSMNSFIITAHHVVVDKTGNRHKSLKIIDHDKNKHDFFIIDSDKHYDIALIKCPTLKSDDGLDLGSYADVEEGDEILLCGFPFGSQYHITHKGMVSAKTIINGRESIQVDASVNQGNSGGPCILLKNKDVIVVGVIVTKLVGANLLEFNKNHKALHDGSEKAEDAIGKHIFKVLKSLFDVFSPILKELDRFINVGFGEAVSVDYAKILIKHQDRPIE